jgi:hypothetical protein
MKPIKTPHSNTLMKGADSNTKDAWAEISPEGTTTLVWELTIEERVAIANGANLKTVLFDVPMPPMYLEISYHGQDGPVLLDTETIRLQRLSSRIAELEKQIKDHLAFVRKMRKWAHCPKEGSLLEHMGRVTEDYFLAREASHCDEESTLTDHVTDMREALENLGEG